MSDQQTTQYRVTAALVHARFATPQSSYGQLVGGAHYYRGQILPEIDPKQRDHLLSLKMIEPVPQPTTEPAEAAA